MKPRLRICAAVAVLVGGLLLPVTGDAAPLAPTLYVNNGAPACSDAGSGTSAQPYCTITKAASVAVAGQTVLVLAGTYGADIKVANSGTIHHAEYTAQVSAGGKKRENRPSDHQPVSVRLRY